MRMGSTMATPPTGFQPWSKSELPRYDGTIRMQLSNEPVPYHFSLGFRGDMRRSDCDTLAMMSCSLACMSADVVRGRVTALQLRRRLTQSCMKRLETMSHLIELHLDSNAELRRELRMLPTIPQWLHGMVLEPDKCEITIHLTIGSRRYWSIIVLRRVGSRWICSHADFG